MNHFDKNLFEQLGCLPASVLAQFERAFELEFGRRCFAVQPPGLLDVYIAIRTCWPKTERERMKLYFKGWRDRQLVIDGPAMPPLANTAQPTL